MADESSLSLLGRLRAFAGGNPQPNGNSQSVNAPPPYSTPGNAPFGRGPMEGTLGTVPEQPEPGMVKPNVLQPYGASGRANFYGLPQPDELNNLLLGQTGLRTFDTMYRTDAHIRRLVLMAWAPIQAATWSLDPFGGDDAEDLDREIAEAVWWMLTQFMQPNLMEHFSTVGPVLLRSGFAPFEQLWRACDYEGKSLIAPKKLDLRLPRTIWRWWQDEYGELTHLGQILPNRPDVVIPMSEVVYYRLAPEGDNWVGTSLLRHAYKSWYILDKLERIDMVGQERKAVGVPIGYPPKNASPETRGQVESMLASVHLNDVGYMMAPGPKAGLKDTMEGEGWLFEVITFDSSSGDSIKASMAYHTEAIASSFLGDFMQLGHHQVGARATAEVQEDPFMTAVEALATASVIPPLQQLIDRITQLNWSSAKGSPKLRMQLTDTASLSEISTYVQQLVASEAMQPDPELEDWLRERADLPPANAEVREEHEAARKAGVEAAEQMRDQAAKGELPSEGEQGRGEGPGGTAEKVPAAKGKGGEPPGKGQAGKARALEGAAQQPPNLRPAKADSDERCITCRFYDPNSDQTAHPFADGAGRYGTRGGCTLFHVIVGGDQVCAKYDSRVKAFDAAAPTAKWWEQLLSQGQLGKAYEAIRDRIDLHVAPAALAMARELAFHRSQDPTTEPQPNTDAIREALRAEFNQLYLLGRTTVKSELAKQRRQLRVLDNGTTGQTEQRRLNAKLRAQHSADLVGAATNAALTKAAIAGVGVNAMQQIAETAATRELHSEVMEAAPPSIGDGRLDAALADPGIVGGYYTSVMDANTCDVCEGADDGTLLSVEDAEGRAPNPACEGGGRCRCQIVWVLSNDPAALGIVAGE